MFASLKTAALSAAIGLGALASVPATAQADDLYFSFGGDRGGPRAGVYIGDGRDRGDYRREYRRVGCSPDRALDKAERMGLRRARVVDVDRRTIEVSGRQYGDRVRVTFANAPGCPIVRY